MMNVPTLDARSIQSRKSIRVTSLLPRKVSRRIELPATINISYVHKVFKERFIVLEAWKFLPVVILFWSQKDNFNGRQLTLVPSAPSSLVISNDSVAVRFTAYFLFLKYVSAAKMKLPTWQMRPSHSWNSIRATPLLPRKGVSRRIELPAAINISHVHKLFKEYSLRLMFEKFFGSVLYESRK